MTADVYAADDDLLSEVDTRVSTEQFVLEVIADADPDVLLRIAAQLNLLNNAPRRFNFERSTDDTVKVGIVVAGCSERAIELVCRKLEQLTSVIQCEQAQYTGP
jgi:acetolactate synthase regulatory subunit